MAKRIDIDPELLNLDGGLFACLPRREMPLAAFGLHGKVIEPLDPETSARQRRARLDSLAPMAFLPGPGRDAPGAPPRMAPWLSGVVVGASAVALAAAVLLPSLGLMEARGEAPSAAVAQVLERAPAPPPATAAVPAPAAPTAFAPAPAAPTAFAPAAANPAPAAPVVSAPALAKLPVRASAPRLAAPSAAAAPSPAAAPAPAPFTTADLPEIPPAPRPPEVPFARASAAVAIASAGISAGACREAEAGPLAVPVTVTFAPSGRASAATVDGSPIAGTAAGSCLARALRGATVPAFDGEPVLVHTTVHLR